MRQTSNPLELQDAKQGRRPIRPRPIRLNNLVGVSSEGSAGFLGRGGRACVYHFPVFGNLQGMAHKVPKPRYKTRGLLVESISPSSSIRAPFLVLKAELCKEISSDTS